MKSFRISIPAILLLISAAMFVVFQRDPLEAQARQPIVWEHKILHAGISDAQDQDRPLREAGSDGWECVGVAFNANKGTTNGVCFALKRPKR